MDIKIRYATKKDLPAIYFLIQELAKYVKGADQVTINLKQLEEDGFGKHPFYWVILAEHEREIIGMSFYYIRYSTWKGKVLFLEDLIVRDAYRGQKIGTTLFEAIITAAKEMGIQEIAWQVLSWNKLALNFYKKFNSEFDEEWVDGSLNIE